MKTAMVKDAYGNTITAVEPHPSLLTAPEIAGRLGLATVRVSTAAHKMGLIPMIVLGTQKNKYPKWVYTEEQIALIAGSLAHLPRKKK